MLDSPRSFVDSKDSTKSPTRSEGVLNEGVSNGGVSNGGVSNGGVSNGGVLADRAKDLAQISIIIPVYNEADRIELAVAKAKSIGDEIIVVDGGSNDGTVAVAKLLGCRLVQSNLGRGQQLNAGSREATGELLLFLHVDTWLSESSRAQLLDDFKAHQCDRPEESYYGGFEQVIENGRKIFRYVEKGNSIRARWQRLIYGDQGMFVCRKTFDRVGGFPEISLMEDFEISRKLGRLSPPRFLSGPIYVDARRWVHKGVVRLTVRNWLFAIGYRIGLSPEWLAKVYRGKK